MSFLTRIETKESMFLILLFAGTLPCPVTSVTESSVSLKETTLPTIMNNQENDGILECHEICGCDRAYIYNETEKECVLDNSYILQTALAQSSEDRSVTNYNQDHDMANDEGMAKQIFIEAEKFFRSIIISALLFAGCASICVLSASFYCCHINYSDRKMEKQLKALAKKLNTKYHSEKSIRRPPLEPIEESCNVVVEDAGANEMFETSLMDLVLTTIGVLLLMALISCLCCLCMKFSDLKLKLYIIKTAKKKGLAVDIDKLEMKKPPQGCKRAYGPPDGEWLPWLMDLSNNKGSARLLPRVAVTLGSG